MIELKSYHTEHGVKTVLVSDHGRKYLHVLVMNGCGLALRKVPKAEGRYMAAPIGGTRAWSTTCRTFARYGRTHGSTKSARRFLTLARKQGASA